MWELGQSVLPSATLKELDLACPISERWLMWRMSSSLQNYETQTHIFAVVVERLGTAGVPYHVTNDVQKITFRSHSPILVINMAVGVVTNPPLTITPLKLKENTMVRVVPAHRTPPYRIGRLLLIAPILVATTGIITGWYDVNALVLCVISGVIGHALMHSAIINQRKHLCPK
jgi:hypothetical protein